MLTVEERFWARVDASGDCWEWTGARNSEGYGRFSAPGRTSNAHRWVWELLVGPIPAGYQIDHLCRNHGCVNPDHLEPVTNRENTLRGFSPVIRVYKAGVCRRGHPLEPSNGRVDKNGHRYCQACRLVWYHANKKLVARPRRAA